MKEKILELLRKSDDYVSGENISNVLGVSRTAIWKHMNALKEEGYLIESSSKKGYKLIKTPDVLTPEEVLPVLYTKYIGKELVHFDSIDSTNIAARNIASKGCREGLVVIAEEQTAGKGRLGRKWVSPKSSCIAFSLVLRPCIKPNDASGITLVMGMAVCKALKKITSLHVGIKWPNDIIINNRKVCGILTEMNAEMEAINHIIVGVGINVNIFEFPEEIKEIATSVKLETGGEVSRRDIIAAVFLEFEELYEDFKVNGLKNIMDEFKSFSVTLGKHVRVISINEAYEGKAIDITEEGLLVVRTKEGMEKRVISGDVSVRGLNGYV